MNLLNKNCLVCGKYYDVYDEKEMRIVNDPRCNCNIRLFENAPEIDHYICLTCLKVSHEKHDSMHHYSVDLV